MPKLRSIAAIITIALLGTLAGCKCTCSLPLAAVTLNLRQYCTFTKKCIYGDRHAPDECGCAKDCSCWGLGNLPK